MAPKYLDKHANARNVHHWDPEVLNNKLKRFGFGLLLVTGITAEDLHVEELIRPRNNTPNAKKRKELLAELDTCEPLC
ncbi:hypothetical protein [Polyangium mundeleinium]|uniref:Uncharacterized protein n=1 Tax=Polyangium mundeleinium TaxID=2995306 RepID=A0ABT5F787_9BACT|nr:hypothetical protein [Polyangium mundeleinium]MDC0748992.1 hypothetical protein [Polyangium mundeleinium]